MVQSVELDVQPSLTDERIDELHEFKQKLLTMSRKELKKAQKTLEEFYTEEEIAYFSDILRPETVKRKTNLDVLQEERPRVAYKFSPEEDDFIKQNVSYLTDKQLALALQIPRSLIARRRLQLGLRKVQKHEPLVVVWDVRQAYTSNQQG